MVLYQELREKSKSFLAQVCIMGLLSIKKIVDEASLAYQTVVDIGE